MRNLDGPTCKSDQLSGRDILHDRKPTVAAAGFLALTAGMNDRPGDAELITTTLTVQCAFELFGTLFAASMPFGDGNTKLCSRLGDQRRGFQLLSDDRQN